MFGSAKRHLLRPIEATRTLILVAILMEICACSRKQLPSPSNDGGANSDGGAAVACTTVGSPFESEFPRVRVVGEKADAITSALDALFAAQKPGMVLEMPYTLPIVSAAYVDVPIVRSMQTHIEIPSGALVDKAEGDRATEHLGHALINAFRAAGTFYVDSHGFGVHVRNVRVSRSEVEYDDETTYLRIPAPDVRVRGPAAHRVMDALAAAGVVDCDPGRKIELRCWASGSDRIGDALVCRSRWRRVVRVGSTTLRRNDWYGDDEDGPELAFSREAARALFEAITAAAQESGFQPRSLRSVAEATAFGASYFQWNGEELGFSFDPSDPLRVLHELERLDAGKR